MHVLRCRLQLPRFSRCLLVYRWFPLRSPFVTRCYCPICYVHPCPVLPRWLITRLDFAVGWLLIPRFDCVTLCGCLCWFSLFWCPAHLPLPHTRLFVTRLRILIDSRFCSYAFPVTYAFGCRYVWFAFVTHVCVCVTFYLLLLQFDSQLLYPLCTGWTFAVSVVTDARTRTLPRCWVRLQLIAGFPVDCSLQLRLPTVAFPDHIFRPRSRSWFVVRVDYAHPARLRLPLRLRLPFVRRFTLLPVVAVVVLPVCCYVVGYVWLRFARFDPVVGYALRCRFRFTFVYVVPHPGCVCTLPFTFDCLLLI